MAKLTAPSGFRDFLPGSFRKRSELIRRIREVYESFGYEGIDTPAMEKLASFSARAAARTRSSCSASSSAAPNWDAR
jgi:histidyl-tRNA synthetase